MNKINVVDKTERLQLGKYYELRGNFKEIKDEEGNISYECDMFRTTNKNDTFEKLYNAQKVQEAYTYLSSTDWIYAKCLEEGLNASEKYPSIVAKRKEMRALINELGE